MKKIRLLNNFRHCSVVCQKQKLFVWILLKITIQQKLHSKLAQDEKNPVIKNLDEQDITYLDEIKYNMATSRAFFLVVRIKNYIDTPEMRLQSVQQVINKCSEFGFDCELADKETIKKHLAIYLSDDVYTDSPPDYDVNSTDLIRKNTVSKILWIL